MFFQELNLEVENNRIDTGLTIQHKSNYLDMLSQTFIEKRTEFIQLRQDMGVEIVSHFFFILAA